MRHWRVAGKSNKPISSPTTAPKANKTAAPARRIEPRKVVGLKALAAHLSLSQTTVSVVLNESPVADSIPQDTKDRIFEAARELGYRPNFLARSLRKQRTFTVGVLVNQIGDGYPSKILLGIEECLSAAGYFYFVVSHRHRPERLIRYPQLLMERSVEGLIFIDTTFNDVLPLPSVAVSGHQNVENVTNVVLDHRKAVELALGHLKSLGHRRIAFMRGQPFSSDSEERWETICRVGAEMNIEIHPELTLRLEDDVSTPAVSYPVMQRFLAARPCFTALFAYNDISAIGAIRALADQGIRVPHDISVVGFDDIDAAEFHTPSLTTVRQPLFKMGEIAAQTLLERLGSANRDYVRTIAIEPELVVRESTAIARRALEKL
ncbi:MAG: LacI family DNA-binding transcriptional regulator [Acidobacteriaceae bacterium]